MESCLKSFSQKWHGINRWQHFKISHPKLFKNLSNQIPYLLDNLWYKFPGILSIRAWIITFWGRKRKEDGGRNVILSLLLGANYSWELHIYNLILFLTLLQMMKETQIFTKLMYQKCQSQNFKLKCVWFWSLCTFHCQQPSDSHTKLRYSYGPHDVMNTQCLLALPMNITG